MEKDELDTLVVDEDMYIDKGILANVLKDYLRITKSAQIIPEALFYELNNEKKVILYLLARKVMKIKGIVEVEGVGPSQISKDIGLPVGSVKTVTYKIGKTLLKSEGGSYIVPNYNLKRVTELIKSG